MKLVAVTFVSMVVAGSLGCTKSTPDFSSLGADDIPQPMFSGSTVTTVSAASTSQTFSISGTCDEKIRDITGTAVGTTSAFSSLTAMSTSGVTVSCSTNGTFSFTLKSLADLGYAAVSGNTYDVQLRAITSGGVSNPSIIHIAFSTAGGPDRKRILLTSGSTLSSSGERVSSGTTFKAEIRVGNKALHISDPTIQDAMTTKSGSAYQMRAGLASQSN